MVDVALMVLYSAYYVFIASGRPLQFYTKVTILTYF